MIRKYKITFNTSVINLGKNHVTYSVRIFLMQRRVRGTRKQLTPGSMRDRKLHYITQHQLSTIKRNMLDK